MAEHRSAFLEFLGRCNLAFRPFSPVDLPDFFKGREEDIARLSSELNMPGRHVAIYGERGVGKSSLAQLAYHFARFQQESAYFVKCEATSTYESIFGQFLSEAGMTFLPNGVESESQASASAAIGGLGVGGSRSTRMRHHAIEALRSIGPAMLLKLFRDRPGLLILDEFDRVQDAPTRTRLAETLKHFSDAASKTKIIVVGVAQTLADLIGQHASLTRCLAQLKLERMKRSDLSEIIRAGEERTMAAFKAAIAMRIISQSDGFPFYTHLLCRYAAEEAGRVLLKNPEAKVVVDEPEYKLALRRAIFSSEGTIRDAYESAIVTTRRKTEMYRLILWAIAYADPLDVQVNDIAANIGIIEHGNRPKVGALSNSLGALVKPEKQEVLIRSKQGFYRFRDPLMRAYVRLVLEQHNYLTHRQLEFPWMR